MCDMAELYTKLQEGNHNISDTDLKHGYDRFSALARLSRNTGPTFNMVVKEAESLAIRCISFLSIRGIAYGPNCRTVR